MHLQRPQDLLAAEKSPQKTPPPKNLVSRSTGSSSPQTPVNAPQTDQLSAPLNPSRSPSRPLRSSPLLPAPHPGLPILPPSHALSDLLHELPTRYGLPTLLPRDLLDLRSPPSLLPARAALTPEPQISDALLKLKVAHGGYVPDIEVFSQGVGEDGRVVGEAYTVKVSWCGRWREVGLVELIRGADGGSEGC